MSIAPRSCLSNPLPWDAYRNNERMVARQDHEQLLSKVWGPEYRDETHYLRLYVTYLRQKI